MGPSSFRFVRCYLFGCVGSCSASLAAAAGSAALPFDEALVDGMAAASAEAEASGEPIVVDELTSEHELVSALPDGSFSAEVSAFPARDNDEVQRRPNDVREYR